MHNNSLGRLAGYVALVAVQMMIASMSTAQGPAPPTAAPTPPPRPQMPPSLPPAHVVNLMTPEGSAAFGAQWKTMEAKIVEGPAIANAMPAYKTSYDIQPHAGESGFDDSAWPTIDAKGLADRRGGGKVSFIWYRAKLTIPAKLGTSTRRVPWWYSRLTSMITRKSGSTGRCHAAAVIRAQPRSRASTCPIASCWQMLSSRATSSR
jgi:hypothetical protein